MKKILYVLLIILTISIAYFMHAASNFKNNLSTTDDVGFATSYYIMHPTMYPKFYSEYLFDKYEKSQLIKLQEKDPSPYKFIIAFYSFDNNEIIDEDSLYKDRLDQLENELVCIGLSEERVNQYQSLFKHFREGSYLVQKYQKLDFESLYHYCNKRI